MIYFMVRIKFYTSNSICIAMSFKISNGITLCMLLDVTKQNFTLILVIIILNHDIDFGCLTNQVQIKGKIKLLHRKGN